MIDAHHPLWTIRPGSHPRLEGDPLCRSMTVADDDAAFAGDGVTATAWIEVLAANPLAELAEAEATRRASGGRIGAALIAYMPLDAADVGARMDACRALGPAFRRVRDILDARHARAPDLLGRPGGLNGLRALAERGLVFDMMLASAQMAPAAALLGRATGPVRRGRADRLSWSADDAGRMGATGPGPGLDGRAGGRAGCHRG